MVLPIFESIKTLNEIIIGKIQGIRNILIFLDHQNLVWWNLKNFDILLNASYLGQ